MTTLEEQIRRYIDALTEQEPKSKDAEVGSTSRAPVLVVAGAVVLAVLAGLAVLRGFDDPSDRLNVASESPPSDTVANSALSVDQLAGSWRVLTIVPPAEGTGGPTGESTVLFEIGPSSGQVLVQVTPPCSQLSAAYDLVGAALQPEPGSVRELLRVCPDDRLISVFRENVQLSLNGEELVAVGSTGIEVQMTRE